jgi:hypothetical protein
MRFTPWMNELRSSSGSPASRSGIRRAAARGRGLLDDLPRVAGDASLDARHLPRREGRRDEAAQLGVAGRVHGEEGLRGLQQLLRQVAELDAWPEQNVAGSRETRRTSS